jgi:hypothetical protein
LAYREENIGQSKSHLPAISLWEVEMEARSAMPRSSSRETSGRPTPRGRGMKTLAALSLSLAIYGMAGWIYVATCALVAPDTLHLPLTHLLPFLREDTSGVLSFILSFTSFVVYQMIRDKLHHPFWRLQLDAVLLIDDGDFQV